MTYLSTFLNLLSATRTSQCLGLGFLIVLLSSCGFHLRGHHVVPDTLKELSLRSETPFAPFEVALKRRLKLNRVELLPDGASTVPVLEIVKVSNGRSARAIGDDKRLREVEISVTVQFRLLTHNNEPIIPLETITHADTAIFDKNIILGQSEEELQIRRDIRQTVIDLLLYRLSGARS